MPKTVGNIVVPVDGDGGRRDLVDTMWAKKYEVILTAVANFLQGKIEGTEFGLASHKFMVNPATGKLAIYEKVNGVNWIHKADFGSVITDQFVFTEPMGGVVFRRKADGYDYSAIRASPTGNGKGIAVGNYAGTLFLVSDLSGVKMVKEKGPAYYHVLPAVNNTTNIVNSKVYSFPVKVTGPSVVYGGTAYLPSSTSERVLICRHWVEAFDGTVLHETVDAEDWVKTDNADELHRVCGAEYVTIPANASTVNFASSIPMPITDYGTAYDVKLCWEFKETLPLYGLSSTQIKYAMEYEEGVIETAASQEWVLSSAFPFPINKSKNNLENICIGNRILPLATDQNRSIAIGDDALRFATNGGWNTAIGQYALGGVTTGWNNVAIGGRGFCDFDVNDSISIGFDAGREYKGNKATLAGVMAGQKATENGMPTAFGYMAGYRTGGYSVYMGGFAGSETQGSSNVGIGYGALKRGESGAGSNIAIGQESLCNLVTGASNVAVGTMALNATTMGGDNTAVGALSLRKNTIGSSNTAVGHKSLDLATTASSNVAVGKEAGRNVTTGTNNAILGTYALGGCTDGTSNVAIGYGAGNVVTVTDANANPSGGTYVGSSIKTGVQAPSHEIVIGSGATGKGSNTTVIGSGNSNKIYPMGAMILDLAKIPTSSTGLEAGAIWRDGEFLKIKL